MYGTTVAYTRVLFSLYYFWCIGWQSCWAFEIVRIQLFVVCVSVHLNQGTAPKKTGTTTIIQLFWKIIIVE